MVAVKRALRKIIFIMNSTISSVEYPLLYILGRLFGIGIVVKYLRNPNPSITVPLLRSFGAKIGEETTFKRSIFIDNSYEDANSSGDFSHIKIGNNCYIGDCVYFDLANEIIIEDNVVISGQVSFITHADCNRSEYLEQKFPRKCQPIKIHKGACIGFRVTILSGATLNNNSIVAANSLLLANTDPKSLYAGSPAKKLRNLE